ncbi:PP2C family protein-serine/threonine phosphatase [Mesomycoplasma moatsii]|uniref:PP2C family protein-serine/threonine phosphatase n=1 Tax=Mesomycoplasma moatsii TaxID=171287 RepID=UPI0003B394D1
MKYIVETNIGVVREENQDRAAVFENDYVLVAVLCDGMGGHFGGSLASSITIETFKSRMNYLISDSDNVYEWFKETIKQSKQNMIIEAGNDENKKDMGTTVTSAIVFKKTKNIIIFNIGDSRTYIFDGQLHQITIDHNLMNYYIKNEGMSSFEASKIPGAAALTSALGPSKKTNIEAFNIDENSSSNKRVLVLTSDGIHDYIEKPKFELIMAQNMNMEEKGKTLIAEAIKGRSADNLTVVIVEVE